MQLIIVLTSIVTLFIQLSLAQENAGNDVPQSLQKCYKDPYLLERDNLLPMTMDTLISLIRKVENSPGLNQDIRQIAVSLVHKFRVDGIEKADAQESNVVLPYNPSGFQNDKHRLLLKRLIQGNANQFPNSSLNDLEQCTFHAMISSTVDVRVRGDEGQRCSQLAQYRSERVPRSVQERSRNKLANDVEIIEKISAKLPPKSSNKNKKSEININTEDEDYEDVHYDTADKSILTDNNVVSQCPVESGVIRTPWGTVSGGALLTGIAAGLQPEMVHLKVLLSMTQRRSAINNKQSDNRVDNRWAATLAGDLAEVALLQIPFFKTEYSVGASGQWNSSALPKWYFLEQKDKFEMTDAEIRGGLDGLIIASKIQEWRKSNSNLKLSQLLEMYYSQNGVLGSGIRACDRRKYFTEIADLDIMKRQTTSFATLLYGDNRMKVTLTAEGIRKFSEEAAEKLSTYVPGSLNDPSCETTSPTPNDPSGVDISTELYIFLDTSWLYEQIRDILGYMLQNINLKPYGSKVTILTASDGNIIANTTDSLSDVFQSWNSTTHKQYETGLSLPEVMKTIQTISSANMNFEKQNSSVGGRSFIALVVPHTATVSDGDSNYVADQQWRLRVEVPDLKFLFAASGSVNRFERFVQTPTKDLLALSDSGNLPSQANSIIKRIAEIPRRIINPKCGPLWENPDPSRNKMNQYITPGSVIYYRLAPNYFFKETTNRKMKIQGQGGGSSTLTVCSSRSEEQPRMNMTDKPSDLNCRQITSNSFDVDLSNMCEDESIINQCLPLFTSVEAAVSASIGQSQCTDPECQYPHQVKFVVETEELGCFSCGASLLANTLLILVSVFYISNA